MSEEQIPPILQTKGLRVIEIGNNPRGAFVKLAANRGPVREVTIYMLADRPVYWTYVYAMYDATTHTVSTYEGRHGDPERDRCTNLRGD